MSVKRTSVLELLGSQSQALRSIPALKRSCYSVDVSIGNIAGDAPKDFIRVFDPARSGCVKGRKKSWVPYIAKVGMKYYPNESIIEQLISDIGRWAGFDMAASKLYVVKGQVRFCSEYFLKKGERLVHGAEIYSRYLNSGEFVKEVENAKKEPEFFDYDFARSSLLEMFPDEYMKIEKQLVLMLLFDALVGNNDRHMYNWGVVIDIKSNACIRFAPIYDSARGLMWNTREEDLDKYWQSDTGKSSNEHLKKYANRARPRIGKSVKESCNHFDLVEHIHNSHERELSCAMLDQMRLLDISEIIAKIERDYSSLLSERRLKTLCALLEYRYRRIIEIFAC